MLAAGWAGVGKQHRKRLAFRLIETLALRHHPSLGVAELWGRSSSLLRLKFLLKHFVLQIPNVALCHASLLYVTTF